MTIRFCISCKHIREAHRPSFEKCGAISAANLVTGGPGYAYCDSSRLSGQPCGPEGKLWEPADKCCDALADAEGIIMHGAECRLNKGWNREAGQ